MRLSVLGGEGLSAAGAVKGRALGGGEWVDDGLRIEYQWILDPERGLSCLCGQEVLTNTIIFDSTRETLIYRGINEGNAASPLAKTFKVAEWLTTTYRVKVPSQRPCPDRANSNNSRTNTSVPLIPLSSAMPLACYPFHAPSHPPASPTTRADSLHNPWRSDKAERDSERPFQACHPPAVLCSGFSAVGARRSQQQPQRSTPKLPMLLQPLGLFWPLG